MLSKLGTIWILDFHKVVQQHIAGEVLLKIYVMNGTH